MKRPELYHKTVDILVQAYFNNELQHTDCAACAVGNILKEPAKRLGVRNNIWANLFQTRIADTDMDEPIRHYSLIVNNEDEILLPGLFKVSILSLYEVPSDMQEECKQRIKDARLLIKESGYSLIELSIIERVFEVAPRGSSVDEWMFNGLMACVDALDKIHENKDSQITSDTKEKFNKKQLA